MIRKWLISKLGGYVGVDDAINSVKDSDIKHDILREAVKDLYNGITEDDVLKKAGNQWMFEGQPITQAEMDQIRTEAQQLVNTRLWKVLRMDMRYQINLKMFRHGRLKEDFIWGQLYVFLMDVLETRLKQLGEIR